MRSLALPGPKFDPVFCNLKMRRNPTLSFEDSTNAPSSLPYILDKRTADMAEAALRLLTRSFSISHVAPSSPSSSIGSPTDIIQSQSRPTLAHFRRSSCGSTTSESSASSEETELQPWRYASGDREQDEVRRKWRETSAKRDRLAAQAWKQFWG